jgi:hypothetical protein
MGRTCSTNGRYEKSMSNFMRTGRKQTYETWKTGKDNIPKFLNTVRNGFTLLRVWLSGGLL